MHFDTANIRIKPTKVHYLKMIKRPDERLMQNSEVIFRQLARPIDPITYITYYKGVGFKLNWLDRLVMPTEDLKQKINASNVHIFVMSVREEPAGYIEFVHENDYVELLYFGLFPNFIGKGLGKYFLNWCIQQAWSYNPKWIQLNTCELDHNNALPTYRKSGFQDYKIAIEDRRVLVDLSK